MNLKLTSKIMVLSVGMVLMLNGCKSISETPISEPSAEYTEIKLNGSEIAIDGNNVSINGKVATITAPGTYKISGSIEDGQIVVNSLDSGPVNIMLDGVSLTNKTGAPIWIDQADKTVLTLEENTQNTVTDAEVYDNVESGVDAAIFSADDLTVSGKGSLNIYANYKDGVSSQNNLTIDGGDITITAQNHGIKGNDCLVITDGNLIINAGSDALRANNNTDATLGYVRIEGGNLQLKAMNDGIYGVTDVTINGGKVMIQSENNGIRSEGMVEFTGGKIEIEASDDGIVAVTVARDQAAEVSVNGTKIDFTN